ncbi:hypothetical protein ACFV1F_47545, partial [Streptomyces sp. NPDC059590]
MVTFAQAQERAELWINGDVPGYQQREVRVREFDLGFVAWAEDRADGPVSDAPADGARLVIARDSGDTSLWPALPVGEVIRRYEEEYGASAGRQENTGARPQRIDLNATSFLLTPPDWLQEAADARGIPDQRSSGGSGASTADSGTGAGAGADSGTDASAAASAGGSADREPAAVDDWPGSQASGGPADREPGTGTDDWPGSQAPAASASAASGSYGGGSADRGADDWPGSGAAGSSAGAAAGSGPGSGSYGGGSVGGGADDWPGSGAAGSGAGASAAGGSAGRDPEPVDDWPGSQAPAASASAASGSYGGGSADRGVDDWPGSGSSVPGAGAGARPSDDASHGGQPGTGSPWATPAGSAAPGAPATPAGGTPWAGADTNSGGDDSDRSVAPPVTVFAPPLAGSDDEDTPAPGVRPDAKTELMSAGSALPPTALAPALDMPPPTGAPAAGPGVPGAPSAPPGAMPGGPPPPPPGAPGAPGAGPAPGPRTPTPPPSGPGAPGAPAGGYVPTQLVSARDTESLATPPGAPGGARGRGDRGGP